jgi:ATP-dependent Lon protease
MSDQVIYQLPVLPLKNAVLFPYLLMPLSAGRPGSIAAVEAALATESKEVLVFTQRDPNVDNPSSDDLYPIGVKAVIRKMSRASEGHLEILVLGMERVALVKLDSSEPFLKARVTPLPLPEDKSPEIEALQGALVEIAGEALTLAQPNSPQELRGLLAANDDPLRLVFVLASMFSLDAEKAQALLEAPTRAEALRLMHRYLTHELQVLELRNKITSEARTEMNKEQRDYLLRQQMRAIQQELGEKGGEQAEVEQLRERLEKAELPE